MNIYIYSDESGVLDKAHNRYYVFGGVIFTSVEERDNQIRRYYAAEENIRKSESFDNSVEIKAFNISNKSKSKLYRNLSDAEKFGIVINQKRLEDRLFSNKKSKQRYLDWAYKMSVRKKLENMIALGQILPNEIEEINLYLDEHSTATNGRYELRESLEKEFKIGMWNFDYMKFYEPLFPNAKSLNLQYCNSSKKPLIRAADIVANHIYYLANTNNGSIPKEEKLNIFYHLKD